MVYETMLLFGVTFITMFAFLKLISPQPHSFLLYALQLWLFLAIGCYFVWIWSHGGQTLAMKTWRIQLVMKSGAPVNVKHATARYILAWLWFMPGLVIAWLCNARQWMMILIPSANMALWALTIYLDPDRQFLHDRLAGTKLIEISSPSKSKN